MRFVREIGIARGQGANGGLRPQAKRVVISTDKAAYAAPAAGLRSDYADNVARIRPQHAPLIKYPDGRTESRADARWTASGSQV